jgi:hypothetical protein
MYARLITMQALPFKFGEMVDFFEACILPATQQSAGCEGFFLLTDEAVGRAIYVVFWQTPQAMNAFDADCLAQMAGDFAAYLETPPVMETYDVRLPTGVAPAESVLRFAETALGIRIPNPGDERLENTGGSWQVLEAY